MDNWIIVAFGLFTSFLLTQLTIWLNNNYFGPRRRLKLQKQRPLVDLMKHGFYLTTNSTDILNSQVDTCEAESGYVGQIRGFDTEIVFDYRTGWQALPNYRIRVFFNPGDLNIVSWQNRLEELLQQSPFFRWDKEVKLTPACAEARILLGEFHQITSENIIQTAEKLVIEVQKSGLEPIEYEAGLFINQRHVTS